MFGKNVYLLAFLVSIGIVANAAPEYVWSSRAKPHEIYIGQRVEGDRLIMSDASLVVGPKGSGKTSAQWHLGIFKTHRITMIRLIDKIADGQGATVEVRKGGPGFRTVDLIFTSRPGYGINYDADVYGKPI